MRNLFIYFFNILPCDLRSLIISWLAGNFEEVTVDVEDEEEDRDKRGGFFKTDPSAAFLDTQHNIEAVSGRSATERLIKTKRTVVTGKKRALSDTSHHVALWILVYVTCRCFSSSRLTSGYFCNQLLLFL